ncbi:A disintegrin and metalloproteinase with thrombospondin motifs 6-like [Antedon mediterranea]|uniref:A disintegrin and metalloproteinase with thrombospondin motifs 6-like n=1 Tax=Antedon mediterranea TaxID=105859 RepID=UPI003AF6ED73
MARSNYFELLGIFVFFVLSLSFVSGKPSVLKLSKRDVMSYLASENIDSVADFDIAPTMHIQDNHRNKRSVNVDEKEIRFNAFEENFHLKVQLNIDLFPASFVIEQIGVNGSTLHTPKFADCHYIGNSVSHNDSIAAISTCNGVNGYINTEIHDLLIRPLRPEHTDKLRLRRSSDDDDVDAHIVIKFDVVSHCSVGESETAEDVTSSTSSPTTPSTTPSSDSVTDNPFEYQEQTSGEKHLELLIFVDYEMYKYHGSVTEEYATVILNVFSSLFLHKSLGVSMKIHVTHLVIITNPSAQDAPTLSSDAAFSLDSFCNWQRSRYDVDSAAVLTRFDIFGSSSRTIGYASISSTCSEFRRCSISEDTGLGLPFTLAHEVAHNLGLSHDGTGNTCETGVNIMSPSTPSGSGSFSWSTCSAAGLQNFLNSGRATCLDNVPRNTVDVSLSAGGQRLPGQVYSPDRQCDFNFPGSQGVCRGQTVSILVNIENCATMFCLRSEGSGCTTRNSPMLDGSPCGGSRWCIQGQCVPAEGPIGGGGSGGGGGVQVTFIWVTVFSDCSRSCGGGLEIPNIICRNEEIRQQVPDSNCDILIKPIQPPSRSCNLQRCPTRWSTGSWSDCSTDCGTGVQHRNVRCLSVSQFGSEQPIADSACDSASKPLSSRSCAGELCQSWITGNWNTCPVTCGDGGVQTRQVFCAIQTQSGQRILTDSDCDGSSKPDTSRACLGSPSCQTPSWKTDNWGQCFGACGESVQTRDVFCAVQTPSGQRVVPQSDCVGLKPRTTRECTLPDCSTPSWNTESWGECSAVCGEGIQRRIVSCAIQTNGQQIEVANSDCPGTRPVATRTCVDANCQTPSWSTGSWGDCSTDCGIGIQTREVNCLHNNVPTSDRDCPGAKPTENRNCFIEQCQFAYWFAGSWSQCSTTCGLGRQQRYVGCVYQNFIVSDNRCQITKPGEFRVCQLDDCPTNVWVTGSYSQCSVICGEGEQSRSVTCRPDSNSLIILRQNECSSLTRPSATRSCLNVCETPDISCNSVLTENYAVFSSPGYPHGFGPSRCTTQITAPPGRRIRLTFSFISLPFTQDCDDHIMISGGFLSRRYCGFSVNVQWTSPGNEIIVVLNTNQYSQRPAFLAYYVFLN